MKRFRENLSAILPQDWRPFVCNGSPYDCKVFVVGHNPATKMEEGFWEYWCDCTGFDKDSWFDAYRKARRRHEEHFEVSPTRLNLNKLSRLVDPVEVLETNVYSKVSKQANELRAEDRVTRVLEFLLREINPELIITHGKCAATHFNRRMQSFDELEIEKGSINGNGCKFVSVRHASRFWSGPKLEKLSRVVCQALNV